MNKINDSESAVDAYKKVSAGYDAYFTIFPIFLPWLVLVWTHSLFFSLLFYVLLITDYKKIGFIFKPKMMCLPKFDRWFWISLGSSALITLAGYFLKLSSNNNVTEKSLLAGLMMVAFMVFIVSGVMIQNIAMSHYKKLNDDQA